MSNYTGCWTLYKKEVKRFLRVYHQTLITPIASALVFFAIFALAIGVHVESINNIAFPTFIASGLIITSVVQNSFGNTSTTLVLSKVTGSIIDYLMPPLSPFEITAALTLGGVTRGVMVGLLVWLSMSFLLPLPVYNILYLLFYLIMAALLLSLLGILTGIMSESFDQMSAVTNYIITPLSFLSGTFFSIKNLPPILYKLSHFNPFFYIIDGFRYGMTGISDGSLSLGLINISITTSMCWLLVYLAFKHGWKLKN